MLSKACKQYLLDLPLPIFKNVNIDFTQSLIKYYAKTLNKHFEDQVEDPTKFEYDSDNDITGKLS